MKFMMNGQPVKLKPNEGAEPSCPRCGNYNAMLSTINNRELVVRECRDCHLIVATTHPEVDTWIVIARSIGKSCSQCGSFEMKETRPGSWMFKCQECGAPAVKY